MHLQNEYHSWNSYKYTENITNVINIDSYTNWKNNYVHLSFDDMLRLFYFTGFTCLGNKLITMSFNSDLIGKFNKKHKLNNYKIKEPVLELRPFMIEIVKKKILVLNKINNRYNHFF